MLFAACLLLLGCSQVVQKHKLAARAVKRFDFAKLLLPRCPFLGIYSKPTCPISRLFVNWTDNPTPSKRSIKSICLSFDPVFLIG